MVLNFSECAIKRQEILDIGDEYSGIKKNFQKDINKAVDGKKVEKAITKFAKITNEANARYKAVKEELKKGKHKV
jgi:hypothetical protein